MGNPMKKKLVITAIFLIVAIAGVFLMAQLVTKDLTAGSPKLGRPTEYPADTQPSYAITDPVYATPEVGKGIQGEEKPAAAVDPAYFVKLYLPYEDEPNVPAGSGFAIEAPGVTAGTEFTVTVFPRGTSKASDAAVEIGKAKANGQGILKMDAPLPTNLSNGTYTIEITGGDKDFKTPFTIRPPMHGTY
jgi:hypothetical protein